MGSPRPPNAISKWTYFCEMLEMEGQFSRAAQSGPKSGNIDKTKAPKSKLQMVSSRHEEAGRDPAVLTFKYRQTKPL